MQDSLVTRALRLAQSSITSDRLQRAYNRAWNTGASRRIAVLWAALDQRGINAMAWFNKKLAALVAAGE